MVPDGLLEKLEALEAAATIGPWEVNMDADIDAVNVLVPAVDEDPSLGQTFYRVAGFPYTPEGSQQRADAALIVEMRNNLPALLDALRATAERVETMHELADGASQARAQERMKVVALAEQVKELKLALSWYVEHDDTNESPDNAEWLEGKHRAVRLLGRGP